MDATFNHLAQPFRIIHGTPPPSWISRFDGKHPEQIMRLIEDQAQGLCNIPQRKTSDIDTLLDSNAYKYLCRLLNILYPAVACFIASPLPKNIRKKFKKFIRYIEALITSPRVISCREKLAAIHTSHEIDALKKQNILIIRLDKIGDCILTIPFLRELKRNYPDTSITLLVNPKSYNLFQNCPHIDRLITYEDNTSGRLWRSRRLINALIFSYKNIKPHKYQIAINPRWDIDDHYATHLAYFSGAPIRIGYSETVTPSKQEYNKDYDKLLTTILYDKTPKHEIERNLKIIEAIHGTITNDQLELYITQEEQDRADMLLAASNFSHSQLTIAIFPNAGSKNREWSISNYIKLSNWLISEYRAQIVIIGGRKDNEHDQIIRQNIQNNIAFLSGTTTLNETAAILQKCHMYIGSDSGPMHLAAAMGTPVIEISCHPKNSDPNHPNSPIRFGPWKVPHIIIQPEKALLPYTNGCTATTAHCINQITIDQVRKSFIQLHKNLRNEKTNHYST
ncbi:MAG: glycosyltransferase family 9 protein [Deltaproteobacteria bacterium]|nr:glycosyltransferase family 9 protein [Deltaproteobacteria bacterium]